MKYFKYIILSVVIVIIIIIAVLLTLVKSDRYVHVDEVEDKPLSINVDKTVREIKNNNDYYSVKNIVESYYYELMQFNMETEDVLVLETEDGEEINDNVIAESLESEKRASKNKIYNILDEEYITKNSITKDNVDSKLGKYKDIVVLINGMYLADINENVNIYFVEGNVIEKENLKKEKFTMTIIIDTQNTGYKIYPNGYKYNIEIGKEVISNIEEIKNNTYNKYNYKIINNENYCREMLKDIKNRLIYDVDSAYNFLDEEYRNKKFSNAQELKDYVSNNYYKFVNSNINSYQVKQMQGYDRNLVVDGNGRYYIFKIQSPLRYEVILDTYTIDVEEFTDKYKDSNNQEKVILNLNKFCMALNEKDYKTAYSMLADSFKANNFTTSSEFENYIKNNFFEENIFEYTEFGDEAGTYYTYDINITDKSGKSDKKISKKFIILLESQTDFKLSFNI